jgi:hypothetical protein
MNQREKVELAVKRARATAQLEDLRKSVASSRFEDGGLVEDLDLVRAKVPLLLEGEKLREALKSAEEKGHMRNGGELLKLFKYKELKDLLQDESLKKIFPEIKAEMEKRKRSIRKELTPSPNKGMEI